MEAILFGKSVLLGLAIAAPLGPIGALCIDRTLKLGFAAGFAGGVGTALADGVYAALAAVGFAALAHAISTFDAPLRVVGGAVLLWLGWASMKPRPPRATAGTSAYGLVGIAAATFLLTITNVMTIVSFAALFAALGLASTSTPAGAAAVVVGVVTGSMLWWCILCGGVALVRNRVPDTFARWVSRVSGIVLIGFGLAALASALRTAAIWPAPG